MTFTETRPPAGTRTRTRALPVIEIFGPTIQGEGPEAGLPCYFVRLGGCDYRCSWCDSMFAVEPSEVREHAERMEPEAIRDWIERLPGGARLVVLSGGNPALHDCGELVELLDEHGYATAVETQGSRWRPWLARVHRLVVSPKPPSSGMVTDRHTEETARFMRKLADSGGGHAAIKIVVFNREDLRWAKWFFSLYPLYPHYLSAGTPQLRAEGIAAWRKAVGNSYRKLSEQVAGDPELAGVRVLPQLHVIAHGNARGV